MGVIYSSYIRTHSRYKTPGSMRQEDSQFLSIIRFLRIIFYREGILKTA